MVVSVIVWAVYIDGLETEGGTYRQIKKKSIILEEKRAIMQYSKDKKLCLLTQYIEVFIEWNKTCNSHIGLYLSLF